MMQNNFTLETCLALDACDPLRTLRTQFNLPSDVIYLDGNSLGPLPCTTSARVTQTIEKQWGQDLIRAWNGAGWFDLPQKLGNQLAPWIGAHFNEVVVTDSTSLNLYKVLSAAMHIAQKNYPERKIMVSERSNFPTDLYIAQSLCAQHGFTLQLIEEGELPSALTPAVAMLMLTHVNYRTGAMHDMQNVNAQAHAHDILTLWDLAHSAGAVPVHLHQDGTDFAVGCGYKYLNGGPGAPAFVWVHPQHIEQFWQPLSGWWGHAAPFSFAADYQPAAGINRYLCGTQPILNMVALECGLETLQAAVALGGMPALRKKSLALSDLFIALVEQQCTQHGLCLKTPRAHHLRGSQVSFSFEHDAYAVMQALIARKVIGDFRAGDGQQHPDILRFGLAPLYIRFVDVWHAVQHLQQVLRTREWQQTRFQIKNKVT